MDDKTRLANFHDELLSRLSGIENALERISLSMVKIANTTDSLMKSVQDDIREEENLIQDDSDFL